MDKKILIIDDDPIATRLMEYTLKQCGYKVLAAQSGQEGMSMAQKEEPDLIILNVMLPGIDGFEVCHRLRSGPQTAHLPILILSGKAQQEDIATGFKMGADDYLTKPAAPSEIISRVENLLARKKGASSKIITFLGSKREVGTTTTVVNLAIAISQMGKRVIAIDLCPYDGSITERLGFKPNDNISHLLEIGMDNVSCWDLESNLAIHQTGVGVLRIGELSKNPKIMSCSDIGLLFDKLGEVTDYFLIDLPFQPAVATRVMLMKCDIAIIVSDYKVDTLTGVKHVVTLAHFLGISPEQMGVVVTDPEGTFPNMELHKIKPFIEANIGVVVRGIIPYDDNASIKVSSSGKPALLSSPDCPMARSINELAQRIIAEDMTGTASLQTGAKKHE